MIRTVAAKELLLVRRDSRLRWTAALILLLLAVACLIGWQAQREGSRHVAAAQAADRTAWLGQGARNPHSAAHFGQYAFKPTSALSFVDPGIDTHAGVAIWMEAHYQDPASFRPAEDRTALGRFAELTAAGVLQLLVPLLIALLAFSAVAGERELGTWKQQLAQGVRPRDLALGKLLGLGAALALPLVPAALLGAVATVFTGAQGLADVFPRASVLAIGYALYFAALLGLAVAISACSRSPRLALLVLFGAWIINGLVAPRAAADLSERLHPALAATDFWDRVRKDMSEGIDGHDPADERRAALEARVLAQYAVATLEELPVSFEALALQAGEEYGNDVFDRRWGELWSVYERQEQLQSWAALVAPALAIRGLSMGMAGTDLGQHRHFAEAAEAHRRVINRQLNEHMARHAGREGFDWKADPAFWEQVASFDYSPPRAGWALDRHRLDLLLLVGWAGTGLAVASVAAARATVI